MEPKERKKLGEILILQKLLTPMIVERVIRIANGSHRRLGQTLEDMGLLTAEEISQALSVQCGYKIVTDICRYNISPEVLGLITLNEAVENRIFPLNLKESRLALAMADPTNLEIVSDIAARLHLQVVIFIATTQEIMKAIAKNYLGETLDQKPQSLLIVNTDPRERQMLIAALIGEGYQVLEAVDAEDGFQQALLQQPRLVITAKDMPFTDGFAFLTQLHSTPETKRIPVILLSQRPSTEEEAIAFQRGFFDYIPMPVKEITLFARVKRALAAGKAYNPHQQDTQPPEIVLE
jgi:PleD family two-component response regulator